jgi:hypothetical protein
MSEGIFSGNTPQMDVAEQAKRASDRLFGSSADAGTQPLNGLDLLRQQTMGDRPSPWGDNRIPPPAGGSDRLPDRPVFPVENGVLRVDYRDPNFDAALAQNNYSKVVITGVPKELSPSPWVDEQGKGFFFWFKNPKNPDASDRNKHYFPSNLKQIEIAQYQGHIYKPVLINADEMRIAASQAYMRQQNDSGYGSYRSNTDAFTYAAGMSKIAGQALQYQENLMRESAKMSPTNPYFHIYLADVLTAEAVQPIIQALAAGQKAYFDNPYTNAKLDEAIRESQMAGQITRQYGNLVKPPAYEMPLSPFGLNPYAYNPDYYWCGAAYQAAVREMQISFLKKAIVLGQKLPIELPPALPPNQ